MNIDKYLQWRFNRVPEKSRNIVNLADPTVRMFFQSLWLKQLYSHLLEHKKGGNK